ncbi:hypothetical protein [Streptomyces olivaceus]|uniref:hypothetical protein n=1 Tax=Streptomyces olivaceus TaxID=47716 RepID=UPI00362D6A0D
MNATASVALIGDTSWKLVGIRHAPNGQRCGHCPRVIQNLYDVVNLSTGREVTMGRGCCKRITGWKLTLAEARRLADLAARETAALEQWGEGYRLALALAEFPDDRAQKVCGGLVSYMLDGSGDQYIARLLPAVPDILARFGVTGVPLEELEARAAEYRAARLA